MGATILVVEDEVDISMMLSSVLSMEGYTVVTAADGREGERAFRDGPVFDLVLTDLRMPHVGGREFFQRIRTICPDIKVIAASAYEEHHVVQQMKREGLHAYLQKPFEVNELLRTVRNVLAQ